MKKQGHINIEQLLTRHRWLIEFICKRGSYGDRDVCAEMIHECYTAIWRRLGTLPRNAGAFEERSWVYWQCRGAVSHYKRRHIHSWHPIDERLAETLAATNDNATRELLEELSVDLNADEQTILRLILEGYTSDEIAQLTGYGIERVKTLRRNMLRRMRQTYEEINHKKQ